MATITVGRDVPGIYRPVSYVPGSVQFTYPARERRTATYRTWIGKQDMRWCAECLLCGQWNSSGRTRAEAIKWATGNHPGWCHVVQGCHCHQPHITAAMAARLGLGAEYPRQLGEILFRLAGGRRKYRAPSRDLHGSPFGAPEDAYYYWR